LSVHDYLIHIASHKLSSDLLSLAPVPSLIERTRLELSAEIDFTKPVRVSRAPGRLDVMGGIADYTGSLVCELPLDRAAAVLLQARADREVQVFSFNLLDEHKPFTLRVPLDALAKSSAETLRREFDQPGRKWAAYLAGCLAVLHASGFVDLSNPAVTGVSLALLSDVPAGAGVSSSAAIEVATMMALRDHFGLADRLTPVSLAVLCQQVENEIVGAPCGVMDQVAACAGRAGAMLRMVCQPHEMKEPLAVPPGMRFVGINSNVKHSVGGDPSAAAAGTPGQYGVTRCAAFMAHRMILDKMAAMGRAAGRELAADPMRGYLANLSADDYKRFFRPYLPEWMGGAEFLARHAPTIDAAATVDPATRYPVQHAADHHVLEARRAERFAEFVEQANAAATREARGLLLDKAGHLMYASHGSYTNDAMLGAPECDLIVRLVRAREPEGLYGARITGGGSGGTVAVLCETTDRATAALHDVMREYEGQTGKKPQLFEGSSNGAWHVGTALLSTH
jgi:galactokinase